VAEVVLALDLPGPDARRLLDRLPEVRWVKVGSILFGREGPGLVRDLAGRGLRVFLDLKWHDIPNTVSGAVEAARELGVSMATVHALGGRAMMEAAAKAAGQTMGLVGVTVLTSHGPDDYAQSLGRTGVQLSVEVDRLASSARAAGLRGVVCSAHEAKRVRTLLGEAGWVVVPGIRQAGDAAGDQTRTATPAEAARAGATHLVVGRPILQAPDPLGVFREMAAQASDGPSILP
jgi:orotidine-5'-phosphate decarboxylase